MSFDADGTDSCGRFDDTLLEQDIDEDLDCDIVCLTCTVPGPAPAGSVAAGNDAWKGLMSKMQENQKKPSSVAIKTNKRGSSSKVISKKVNQLHVSSAEPSTTSGWSKLEQKPEKKVISKENVDIVKDETDQTALHFMHEDNNNVYNVAIDRRTNPDCHTDLSDVEPPSKRSKLLAEESESFVHNNDNEGGKRNLQRARKVPNSAPLQHQHRRVSSTFSARYSALVQIPDNCPSLVLDSTPKPEPAQLFPIFMPKSKDTAAHNAQDTSNSTGICSFKSQYDFNHVNYDYPEIHAGWNTPNKTVIALNETRSGLPAIFAPTTKVSNNKQKPRTCPFYKMIPGTKFSVDAFSYGVIPGIDVYFLSHFHSDHYVGLTKKFASTVVCSAPTGNLVNMKLGVAEECIKRLELNKVYVLQGAEIVLIEANHCPGSVIFLFRLPNGSTILHTGDFRYTADILTSPYVKSLGRVSTLYLDTTYCDPRYDFPSQADAVNQVIITVQKHLSIRPRTLVLCGAYCIGKERVFFSLAEAINSKVYCAPAKFKMLSALDNHAFNLFMKPNEDGCRVHVVGMGDLNPSFLTDYLRERLTTYNNIVAIRPSGWEFSKSGKGFSTRSYNQETVTIIGVPYSEHSSFSELRDFVKQMKPIKVQPTVNVGSEVKRNSMTKYIDQWLMEPR